MLGFLDVRAFFSLVSVTYVFIYLFIIMHLLQTTEMIRFIYCASHVLF